MASLFYRSESVTIVDYPAKVSQDSIRFLSRFNFSSLGCGMVVSSFILLLDKSTVYIECLKLNRNLLASIAMTLMPLKRIVLNRFDYLMPVDEQENLI